MYFYKCLSECLYLSGGTPSIFLKTKRRHFMFYIISNHNKMILNFYVNCCYQTLPPLCQKKCLLLLYSDTLVFWQGRPTDSAPVDKPLLKCRL